MNKTKFILSALITLLCFSAFMFSCNKSANNSGGSNPTEEQKAQLSIGSASQEQTDNMGNEIFANVMGVNADLGIGGGIGVFDGLLGNGFGPGPDTLTTCFTVSITPENPLTFPKTVIINFGSGCTGHDGHTRKGKIITVYTGPMIIPGNIATTTFEGFYRDSIKVEGTHIIKNSSTSDHLVFMIRVENGQLSTPSGNYILWNKNITITQIDGFGTPHFPLDDVYSMTGSGNGTTKHGETTVEWKAEIVEPLIREFTCRWAIKGTVRLTVNTISGLFDYGNGDCDNEATLTVGTLVIPVTLP